MAKLYLPFDGRVYLSSPFGWRNLNGVQDYHRGIDVVGVDSKEIRAVRGGNVVSSQIITDKSNRTWEWGNYVCILGDDGMYYYYCHMSERYVSKGQTVAAGDIIGVEGNTGYSFGSHCHFEVRKPDGTSVNPAAFIGIENVCGSYTYTPQNEEEDMNTQTTEKDNTPSEWAREAVEWAIEDGIMYGDEHGDLMLRKPCTREQMIVFLHRLYLNMTGGAR